jgi:phosphoribosylaminoimidazole-succinocarboxamide synthase
VHSGKIRELYALPDDQLLLLATDNVSAYDRVLPTPIPGKGAVLTQLTTWWLGQLSDVVPTHLVSTDVPADVIGRALVVEKLDMIPVECVVRGYLAGSGWKEYSESGTVAGLNIPQGLQRGERLERPIFTPASKAPQGSHDENITFAQLVDVVGEQTALELRRASLRLYVRAERVARERGLVLVDTKFEFGRRADGTLVLADEVLTPDSSRYWAADSYAPGTEMPSLDKQQLRDWITNDSGWDPDSGEPAPVLPDDVVAKLSQTYADTYERHCSKPQSRCPSRSLSRPSRKHLSRLSRGRPRRRRQSSRQSRNQ